MPQTQLIELRKYLLSNLGLNFSESQDKELFRKIEIAAKEHGYSNTYDFINWIINNDLSPAQIEKLASFLTIGETYFFRETKALDYLEQDYLPKLIYKRRNKDKRLRIWCAGCASGDEPYTVAIILRRIIPDIKKWNITILATDINATFLEKARKGIYTKWSFRGVPDSFKKDHFIEHEDGMFKINKVIKDMVTFTYHNLAKDTYPSLINNTNAMDVILCRNVLIYFSKEGIIEVSSNFYKCLRKGGVMLLSPVESSNLISGRFNRFQHEGITVYNKGIQRAKKKSEIVYDWESLKLPTTVNMQETRSKMQENGIPEKTFSEKQFPLTLQDENVITKSKIFNTIPESPTPLAKTTKPTPKTTEVSEYKKAYAFFKAGKFEDAEAILSDVLNYNKNNIQQNILLLARIKANLGKLDDAKQLCKKAINIDKLNPVAHYLLATIYGEKTQDVEAIQSLKKALFLNPDFTLAYFLLGRYSIMSGKKAQGKKYFNNALITLSKLNADDELAESDGLTVGRLIEIIERMKEI